MQKTKMILCGILAAGLVLAAPVLYARDRDNNPPGKAGGAGTNWENPPGPQGGLGASPDKKGYGNPPGPKGGPGAGPRFDEDNNPPGKLGGPGTNWENPPGKEGGSGASPDYRKIKGDFNHDGTVDQFEEEKMRRMAEYREEHSGDSTGSEESTSEEGIHYAKADRNHDGVVDDFEKKLAMQYKAKHPRKDLDNNPPGMAGGAGTNWENPPGAQGGPGASPDKKGYGHINPPGPKGGPGAGPRFDKDNNPPGKAGGAGTNWENPPGKAGGPGASPNKARPKVK